MRASPLLQQSQTSLISNIRSTQCDILLRRFQSNDQYIIFNKLQLYRLYTVHHAMYCTIIDRITVPWLNKLSLPSLYIIFSCMKSINNRFFPFPCLRVSSPCRILAYAMLRTMKTAHGGTPSGKVHCTGDNNIINNDSSKGAAAPTAKGRNIMTRC